MSEVLDLTQVFDRHTVKLLSGQEMEVRNPEELSILEEQRLKALLRKTAEISEASPETEEAAVEASKTLHDLAALLVVGDLPAETSDWECAAIVRFWTEKSSEGAAEGDPPRPRRTTAASSRGSRGSTAATRKPGSRSRSGR